jgi:4-diphosphocytidyl-2-C-methyl-D-erythritol kinase
MAASERATIASLRVRAPAKINRSLHVLGRRRDGYHDIRTRFQSIALHDTLTFRVRPGPFRIVCNDPRCPADQTNLVWRAAAAMWERAGRRGKPGDLEVRIRKRIPVEAGLGGASSDAAATLRACAKLWRVAVSERFLARIGSTLGADVPFFFAGGSCVGTGRGDVLERTADAPRAWVVLAVPAFGVSTRAAYAWWDAAARRRGRIRQSAAAAETASNHLEPVVAARHPQIARLAASLRKSGARHAAMSGSGSTVFGLFDTRASARQSARALASRHLRIVVTRTVDRQAYQRLAAV